MTATLRLVLVNTNPIWGGGERWYRDVSAGMARRGHSVVVACDPDGELWRRIDAERTERWPLAVHRLSFLDPLLHLRLARRLAAARPHAVIATLPSDLKIVAPAARRARIPRVVYRRGLALPVADTPLNRWLLSRAVTDVIANSNDTARQILARNPLLVPPGRLRVIHNGVDEPEQVIDPSVTARVHSTGNPQTCHLLVAGRLTEQKGHIHLLRALASPECAGIDLHLWVAGSGELAGELEHAASRLGVADRVTFLGFIADVPSWLEATDLLVLPSRWEGFGYVLVEAMIAGRAVVAFDVSSVPEIVTHGATGLLCPPGDEAALAAAIASLAGDPDRRAELGRAGRERARRMFTLDRCLDQLEGLLRGPRPM